MSQGKRYDEKAVAQILRRAAELEQGGVRGPAGGMSQADIETVAIEAGLTPGAVRAAIAEQEQGPAPGGGFLGGPLQVRHERVIEAELDEQAVEEVLSLAQHELGMYGKWYRSGNTYSWSPKGVARNLQVRVQVRRGRTEIQVGERLGPLVGGLWGGMFGGLGGASLGLAVPLGLAAFRSFPATVAIFGACMAGAYLLTRSIYKAVAGKRQRELARLADRLLDEGVAQTEAMALAESAEGGVERALSPRMRESRERDDDDDDSRRRSRKKRRSRD